MKRSMVFAVMFVVVVVSAQQPFIPRPGLFNAPYTPTPFAPANPYAGPLIPILDYSNEINIDGSYRYNFATADGKQAEESGYLKDVSFDKDGEPIGIQVVQGSYSYTAPDGTPIQVSYIADENGFQPTAVRIPQDGRYNPALINPALINPAVINPAVINPAVINPAIINPVLNPRANIFPNQFRNPYVASARLGRYNSALHNNLKPYDANANNQ